MVPVGLAEELDDDSGTATTEVVAFDLGSASAEAVAFALTEADVGGGSSDCGGVGRRYFGAAGGFGKTTGAGVGGGGGTSVCSVASIGLPAADPHGTSGTLIHSCHTPVSGWT